MPTLTIDGRTVRVRDGASLLVAAQSAGIDIPTLCHHPALEPWGGCRLCLVEVTKDTWRTAPRLVASCMYPAENGLIVRSATERVRAARRVVLDLLLARCPETPLVQRLARDHGIERTSYQVSAEPTNCILCGLCTRTCDHIGVSAIASISRGAGREIAPPFREPPPACVGCLACAEICPTGHIRYDTNDRTRTIWGRTFDMVRCRTCGRASITRAQAAREIERHGVPAADVELCDACKRRQTAATFASLQAAEGVL
jgi:NADH dehydrogenase/NADH:ubiquinone oxidoreductase subunit G